MTVANVNVTKVLFKRGNTVQNNNYTGVSGEISIDTQTKTLRVHDGITPGGNILTTGGTYGNSNVTTYLTSVAGNIIPSANVTYSLGDATHQWRDLWVSNNTIYIGNVPLTVSNGNLLINGNSITSGGGTGTDDVLRANVGAYQIYANANAATQTISINSINSNITAANSAIQTLSANIGTLVAGAPGALDTLLELGNALGNSNSFSSTVTNWLGNITSNVTAANSSINTFNANLGAYQTFANSNAATQANTITTLQTQVYANANVATYLPIYSGNIAANIVKNGYTWTFGTDGITTLPAGTITSDTSLQLTTTFGNYRTVEYQTAGVWDVYVEDDTTGPNDAWSWIDVTFKDNLINKPQVFIENQKASDGIARRWTFDENGNLTLPAGSILSETANTTVITPPGALAGQSLVIRLTGAQGIVSDHPGGFADGDTITLTVTPDYSSNPVTGTVDYTFTGATSIQLGRALTGTLTFTSETAKPISWTIPVSSTMTTFTITLSNASGFDISGIAPLTLTSTGSSEDHHIHLIAGDPSITDIYLGDDDQYVKIEKNAGNVVIGTDTNTKQWTFDTDGNLALPETGYLRVGSGIVPALFASSPAPIISGFSSISAENFTFLANGVNILSTVGGTYSNTNVAAYLSTITTSNVGAGNLTVINNFSTNVISANTFTYANGVNILNGIGGTYSNTNVEAYIGGNIGAYQTFANANAATQATSINTTNANIGAFQLYANANIGTLFNGNTSTNANIGAYQTFANANAATQATSINTVNANIGAYQTFANANVAGLRTSINSLVTTANTNTAAYLAAGISTNITTTGSVSATNFIGNGVGLTNVTVSAAGNIVGTSSNVTLVAGNYSYTFDNTGNVTLPANVFVGVTNTFLPNTVASFSANVNYYSQVTLQNKSSGNDATADYIATANNGSDTVNFLDLGIINSGYDNTTPSNSLGNIVFAADSYIYAQGNASNVNQSGGNLAIGTATIGKTIKFFAGGTTSSAIAMTVANTGVTVGGNITATGTLSGNGSGLTGVALKTSGSWTVTTGTNTYSFTVPASGTYQLWVDCNIPNGILAWSATATITNTNVPVVGAQYAWVYNGGGSPIDFVSIPNQFIGTANTIVRNSTAPSLTTNRFDFGINNTSGGNVTVRYGWVAIS